MGFGGPVWHASASAMTKPTAWRMAEQALEGVGDAALGEWREDGSSSLLPPISVVHIRRRLTEEEVVAAGRPYERLHVRDVRGTTEERERIRALLRDAPQLRGLVA